MDMREEHKNITIEDIAAELGVSKTTVSRAISGKGRIGAETRARVMEYINIHGYKPNIIAKGLAQSKTYNICVVLPSDYNLADLPFFQTVQVGICEYLSARDYDVVLTNVSGDNIGNLERIISNRKVDGVLLTRTEQDDKAVAYLKDRKVPFVTLGTCQDKEAFQIDADHRGGSRELTTILIMKGMKRIALLGGNSRHIVTESRLKGFMEAHQEMGMVHPRQLFFENLLTESEIEQALDNALKEKADSIICMDDHICGTVLRKLKRDSIRIPQELKVASFFGSTLLNNHSPGVSCLEFDTKELGMMAGKIILEILQGENIPQKTLLGYKVILKESTK